MIALPTAVATGGGKALPTCRYAAVFLPENSQSSGKPWTLVISRSSEAEDLLLDVALGLAPTQDYSNYLPHQVGRWAGGQV
jgi:hypothetical protein